MRTIDKIITKVDCKYGAPMGRESIYPDLGDTEDYKDKRTYDCAVPMSSDRAYDKGGAYWGIGAQLRVRYTKDLHYVEFYRVGDEISKTFK